MRIFLIKKLLIRNIYKTKSIELIMARGGEDFSGVSYTLGIMSIIFAFITPLAGFVLGIVGLVYSKKQQSQMASKAKKLNVIGIVLSLILFVVTIAVAIYVTRSGGIGALI